MKKILLLLGVVAATVAIATAQNKQTKVVKDEKTEKKTSSIPQKVHNTFSKHKEHNGRKTKRVKVTETTNNKK